MGPIAILDKSALQALTVDESVWLEAFLTANVVPIFYVETLADLEKDVASGKTPESVVGRLAEKTPAGSVPNLHHRYLVLGELTGSPIDISTGRPVIGDGDLRQAPDGKVGLHVDEFPESVALHRWQNHEFLEVERGMAKAWRDQLKRQDLSPVVDVVRNILPEERKISDLAQLKEFVDEFCSTRDREVLALAFEILDIPDDYRQLSYARWEAAERPTLDEFAPYLTHVFKVDLLFYLGIQRGFISGDRASNRADMAYLYYLPFSMVFVSGDGLHKRTVPLFLRDKQYYLSREELKDSLREFDEHFEGLPEAVKALGVMRFAGFPPSAIHNSITRLWDQVMRPDWREISVRQERDLLEPNDEAAEADALAEVTERIDKAESLAPEESPADPNGADYVVVKRQVRSTMGKWRIVSSEAENADAEDAEN